MNILFTADSGYMDHVKDCIRSMIRFRSGDGYDIYILHSDAGKEKQDELTDFFSGNARLHFIHVDPERFSDFPESTRYPKLIYYRIFAAQMLPMELDRILYLDGDTIVINPLKELYHMEFDGNAILACTHIRSLLTKINQYRLGVKEECPYINSGVMLMNLKALRQESKTDEIMRYVRKQKNFLALPDQDIITAVYGGKIGLLDTMKYNLSDRMLSFYNSAPQNERRDLSWVREHTVIIHYYGKQKPWDSTYHGRLDIFYKELRSEKMEGM